MLRKLSHEDRHNRLLAAAREFGRVLRTVYLLRWNPSTGIRHVNADAFLTTYRDFIDPVSHI